MLFSRSAVVFSLLALTRVAVGALPPACLLDVVGGQPSPSDLNTICGSNASKIQSQISSTCKGNAQAALSAFSSTCSSAGHEIVTHSSTTSGAETSTTGTHGTSTSGPTSATPAISGSIVPASSGFVVAVATPSPSGYPSGIPTATPSQTPSSAFPLSNGAASPNKQMSAAAFAAVVFVGFAATL